MIRGCNHLCRSFRDQARIVQRDMEDALRLGIPRNEETITETLLLNLARSHPPHELKIKTYTRSEEGVNGADWEFWFANSSGVGIPVRVQAKRMFPSGQYEQLFHQSKTQKKHGTNQCRELIRNAGSSIPVYVFYNETSYLRVSAHRILEILSRHRGFTPSDWGITLCSAFSVRAARDGKDDRPENLDMVPWHYLVCDECWGTTAGTADLPYVVSHALKRLFEQSKLDSGELAQDLSFEPTARSPQWVGQLREVEYGSAENLEEMMRETNLRGVAIIEQPLPEEWEE